MDMLKKNSIPWIYFAVLAVLFGVTLVLLGYEHLINPEIPVWMVVVNLLLISIPLILLYGSIGLILFAMRQKALDGEISIPISRFLYYTPRIAGVLMIIFVALFALDMFGGNESFWQQLLGFVLHAAPSILLAILMFFAWRKPVIGFIVFALASVVFLRFVFGSSFGPGNFVMFVAPMAVISAMFWINWKWGDVIRLKPQG